MKFSASIGVIVGLALLLGPSCSGKKGEDFLKSYIWMGDGQGRTEGELRTLFLRFKTAGLDGVMYQCGLDRYPEIIPLAKEAGLEVHAWQPILLCNDKEIMDRYPSWFAISRDGKSSLDHPPFVDYYHWLCPSNPSVLDYLTVKISKLAAVKGLEGIHMDYIRYSDVILPRALWEKYGLIMDRERPEFDFCYCDECRERFFQIAGRDPIKIADPESDRYWKQYRLDSITNLVNSLARVARRQGKRVSAAVFPTPEIAKKLVRQDWVNWDLDAVYPMVYHNFYEKKVDWIGAAVKEGVDALEGSFPLISGLYVPSLEPDELAEAVGLSKANGASGVCLFNASAMTEDHWGRLPVRR